MLSSGLASAIALVTLIGLCVIGGVVGFVTSRVFRLPWNLKVAGTDVALVVFVSVGFAFSAVAMARGQLDIGVKWILLAAAVPVVVRHLVRLTGIL